jgi:POT family proton-dependent oligopeptide transporter
VSATTFLSKFRAKDLFGHPAGLYVLFMTEMWERFSYYGMRVLLVLYMTQYLLIDPERVASIIGYDYFEAGLTAIFGQLSVQQMSSQIYGLYTGFVYFTPFFGGILADRVLGQSRSIYLGAILMAIGHFLMAYEQSFLIALVFLILGCGCFKPNISTQVGSLYPDGDPRRDSAYTIFYMGINLGATLSPFVCGVLGQVYGWHYGFGAAGVGMVLGLIIYWLGSPLLPRESVSSTKQVISESRRLTREEWFSVLALAILCFLNISFWAVYEQQGNTLQLWAEDRTNWNFFGIDIPSTLFQSFNPMMIIIFAPLLTLFWTWQGKYQPSTVTKMGIGCVLCGAAYIFMILAAQTVPEDQRGSVMWLVGTVFIFTMGELYLSPIGLSLVSKIAPKPILNMMMGMWFMSSFFGNYLAGYLGTFYEIMPKQDFFMMLMALGVGTGVVFMLIRRPVVHAIGKDV